MTIQVGDRLPPATLRTAAEGMPTVSIETLFGDRAMVLFGVPGAFTPTCSNHHLPGYVKQLGAFSERGIGVVCLAVNDAFVMQAWARSQNVPPELVMLADGNGSFTRALGLDIDGSDFGMGLRARRFALYADAGVVTILHVEAPGELRVSRAESMLQAIDQPG